jgi:hypothetical protein
MFLALVYIGALIALGGLVMFIRSVSRFLKLDLKAAQNYKKILLGHLGWMGLGSLGLAVCLLGATLNHTPALSPEPILQSAIGGFLALFFFEWIYSSFALYNYKKDLDRDTTADFGIDDLLDPAVDRRLLGHDRRPGSDYHLPIAQGDSFR